MKIKQQSNFHGKPTKRFPIFTIDTHGAYTATGSINGELKIHTSTTSTSYKDHTGAVLCVRFSKHGFFLATASDDWGVVVYRKVSDRYLFFKRLVNHSSDVCHVLWHRKFLVTCGYDGFICTYSYSENNNLTNIENDNKNINNIENDNNLNEIDSKNNISNYNNNFNDINNEINNNEINPTKINIIENEIIINNNSNIAQSFTLLNKFRPVNLCRGISTDPSESLITVQGEDFLIIFNCNFEEIYRQPFTGRVNEAFFSRCSWSPNGELFALCLSHNKKSNTVDLLKRCSTDINRCYINISNSPTYMSNSPTDINNSHTDINNSIIDINNSTTDINNSPTNINNSPTDINNSINDINKFSTDMSKSFERVFSLIGHVAPIEVVSFFPAMLYQEGVEYSVIAVSSQDRSLSFWCSINSRPFLLLKNVFEGPVMDMQWRGMCLEVCSFDGTVRMLEFGDGEFGEVRGTFDMYESKCLNVPFSMQSVPLQSSSSEDLDEDRNELDNNKDDLDKDFHNEVGNNKDLDKDRNEDLNEDRNNEVDLNISLDGKFNVLDFNKVGNNRIDNNEMDLNRVGKYKDFNNEDSNNLHNELINNNIEVENNNNLNNLNNLNNNELKNELNYKLNNELNNELNEVYQNKEFIENENKKGDKLDVCSEIGSIYSENERFVNNELNNIDLFSKRENEEDCKSLKLLKVNEDFDGSFMSTEDDLDINAYLKNKKYKKSEYDSSFDTSCKRLKHSNEIKKIENYKINTVEDNKINTVEDNKINLDNKINSNKDHKINIEEDNNKDLEEDDKINIENKIYIKEDKINLDNKNTDNKDIENKIHLKDDNKDLEDLKLFASLSKFKNSEKINVITEGIEDENKNKVLNLHNKKEAVEDNIINKHNKTTSRNKDPNINANLKPRRRIQPILIGPLEEKAENVVVDVKNKNLVLFRPKAVNNDQIKRKVIVFPLTFTIAEFKMTIENKEKTKVQVYRGDLLYYTLNYDRILLFSGNKYYLVFAVHDLSSDSLVIHHTKTGNLVLPIIKYNCIIKIEVLNHLLLVLKGDSTFQVTNIKKRKEIANGCLPTNLKLININLDSKYFIIAQYSKNILFYDINMKVWLKKSHSFNTILLKNNEIDDICFDESEENDDTANKLEYDFVIKEMVNDHSGMLRTCRKMVLLVLKADAFSEMMYHKFVRMFGGLVRVGFKRNVYKFLEEMNCSAVLQPYVFEMYEEMENIRNSCKNGM